MAGDVTLLFNMINSLRLVVIACVLVVTGQALAQAPMPPALSQQKRTPIVSKPVRLTPPPAKPAPSSSAAKKPKTPPKPALKVFQRKREKLNFIGGDRVLIVGDGLLEKAQNVEVEREPVGLG